MARSTKSGARRGAAPPVQRRPARRPAGDPVELVELVALADTDADALADQLHDGVLQSLVVARYAADAVVRGADPVLARDAVQEALVALRRAVWMIRPRTDLGLAGALVELSDQRSKTGHAPLGLDLDLDAAAGLAPAAVAVAYRLVQASGAGSVRLVRSGAGVRLELDRAVPDAAGWRVRAAAVGGRLVRRQRTALLLPLAHAPDIAEPVAPAPDPVVRRDLDFAPPSPDRPKDIS